MSLTNQQIASIILEQLGGNKFAAMTGAKNLSCGSGDDQTLYFSIPTARGINHVAITLDVNDTYRMTFSKIGRSRSIGYKAPVIIATVSDVYADQLQSIFTEQTGLATRL